MFFKSTQITKVPEKLLSYAVHCKNLTVSNARTVLLTSEIYISQNVYEQLLDLLLEAVRGARKFHICGHMISLKVLNQFHVFDFVCDLCRV